MPAVTPRRAMWIAAVIAALAYANAPFNGWAGDDLAVVRDNPTAHSISAAIDARFKSYWPPPFEAAGLYRPTVVISYAMDWVLSGGQPWMFHTTNVALHALATALVVLLALAWLPPGGALAAGLVFSVHPVHVEAVANVVGRAEVLAGAALLGALLCARRFRSATTPIGRAGWAIGTVFITLLALLTKEHAVVAIALLGLDWLVDRRAQIRGFGGLLVAVAALTLGWLYLWRSIAGGSVNVGATSAFYGLTPGERVATMLPAQLDLVRLLVWPFSLSSDYSPMVIPVRTDWTVLAGVGGLVAGSIVLLGLVSLRRAPAVAFGVLLAAVTYLPTSNLLFASGVVLAERTLYLAVLAPALVAGWLVARSVDTRWRTPVLSLVGLTVLAYGVRSFTRTPFWRSPITPVIEEVVDHPESYRARLLLGDLLVRAGDSTRALSEYLSSGAIFERDPFVPLYAVRLAGAMGRHGIALSEARRAVGLVPDHPAMVRAYVQALIAAKQGDSGVAVARAAIGRAPDDAAAAETYLGALRATRAPLGARMLAEARFDWLGARPVEASRLLDSVATAFADGAQLRYLCRELTPTLAVISALRPALLPATRAAIDRCRLLT